MTKVRKSYDPMKLKQLTENLRAADAITDISCRSVEGMACARIELRQGKEAILIDCFYNPFDSECLALDPNLNWSSYLRLKKQGVLPPSGESYGEANTLAFEIAAAHFDRITDTIKGVNCG